MKLFSMLSLIGAALAVAVSPALAQEPPAPPRMPDDLGIAQGTTALDTPEFSLKLGAASQDLIALQPKIVGAGAFDFAPSDRLNVRTANGFYHLGDITFRARAGETGEWRSFDSAAARQPVRALAATSPGALAVADLAPTLPADCPLQITRTWALNGGHLVLRFALTNKTDAPLQIGSLGIPLVFNNIITDRDLKQSHEICSFSDPYIGLDAGYLQVTRLNGAGPALVVVPENNTPFEAYRPLREPMRTGQTFEGMFAWMPHSQAYAENEWKNAKPWNAPSSVTLVPGQSRVYGLKFLLSPTIRGIENTLATNRRPVAQGVPGYILPADLDGKLFLKYGARAQSFAVEPAGALEVSATKDAPKNGWQGFDVRARKWGRARLTITYADGLRQVVSYYNIKPAAQTVADMGNFLMTKQWFERPNDPFGRSPSVMSYDREADKIVEQDSRVWIAGLGDEAGSGSWLAAGMKEFGQPNPSEIARYEKFVDGVLWGGLQNSDGPEKYGVRKSLFFYDPKVLPDFPYDKDRDWKTWTSWSKIDASDVGRSFNYAHVVAVYWALYQIARNHPGLVKNHQWDWYLNQAYETLMFMTKRNAEGNRRVGYVDLGQIEGDVYVEVLKDMKREGWSEKAMNLEARMKERADFWDKLEFPFGSEMAWDSTGQEEVYAWSKYFGYNDKAQVSLNSIIGYMPTVPHWGYNGNARRYWDFWYGGKITNLERQLHHYGSGINAIPVLSSYRENPNDFYLLRVGYGGMMGALSNIDQEGFASAAFHSFPSLLKWDPYSGDYGPGFFGHAYDTATYIVNHPDFGWQAFGGNVQKRGDNVSVQTLDSFRRRVYIAPLGLWLTLDAGQFESVEINAKTGAVRVQLAPATEFTKNARLRIEQPAKIAGVGKYQPTKKWVFERDAYTMPLKTKAVRVELKARG